ncbi:hypothetical protein [uncultured Sphingomonas sp.]|uniref:hypothetical protein n=1 Tax=uncultured Sphingomonas sp. TaxID=158754 RepID=UPI0035C98C6A
MTRPVIYHHLGNKAQVLLESVRRQAAPDMARALVDALMAGVAPPVTSRRGSTGRPTPRGQVA